MEEEDVAIHIVEMLLLMDAVTVMKHVQKDQQEIPILTEMSDNTGEMTQFVASTEDIYGDNAMITQEDNAFVPQEILMATQMDVPIIVHLHHIKTINNNKNPVKSEEPRAKITILKPGEQIILLQVKMTIIT
jgi:hypothetical protein